MGWREWVALPLLDIPRIKAKIDTGAKTSALHAFEVTPFERDGQPWVAFSIHPKQRDTDHVIACEAPAVDQRIVRDSGGHEELRYVIATEVDIGGERYEIEMTLTARDDMGFRMLLGRAAIRGHYVVDPAQSYLTRPARKRTSRKTKTVDHEPTTRNIQ